MENWNHIQGQRQIIEPPPELPIYKVPSKSPHKEVAGKRFVNKVKGWFSGGRRNDDWYSFPEYLAHGRLQKGESAHEDSYSRHELHEIGESGEDDPHGNSQRLVVQESAKTFLTGNNIYANHIPQFPAKGRLENHYLARKKSLPDMNIVSNPSSSLEFKKRPMSLVVNEPQKMSVLATSSLQSRNVTLHKISRRLNSIGNKKLECAKLTKKLLKDLTIWGEKTTSDNIDVTELVEELYELFQKDMLLEQKISERLKVLTNELEFIGKRENEMAEEKRHLLAALKKYDYCKERRGENDEESNLFKERVMAHEKSYETYQLNYQYAVSVSARQLFKEVAIEYYERTSDLKENSGAFLLNALKTLENTHNNEVFLKDLDKLRMLRAERNWTRLKPEQRNNPQNWVDLVSGKHDNDDTLMKKVYEGLPIAYTPMPEVSPAKTPHLDLRTGLEESFSGIKSDRFNPITSNEFFLDRSPSKNEDDQDESNYETVRPDRIEEKVEEDTIPRSLNPNVLKDDRNKIPSLRTHLKDNTLQKKIEVKDKSPKGLTEIEKSKHGFLVNFGEMSRQFKDAEQYLQENKWTEPSA